VSARLTAGLLPVAGVDFGADAGHKRVMTLRYFLHGLLFQLAWFAAVLAAARGWVLLSALAPLAVAALGLWQAEDRRPELKLIGIAVLVSLVGDSLVLAMGRSVFAAHWPISWLPPLWVIALWMGFATLANTALRWFRDHLLLVGVLGAVFGPLTYYGGAELGAGRMGEPFWPHVAMLAVLWGAAAPFLLWLAKSWERPAPTGGLGRTAC
jgi:hypothetical protein